jgi:hypothetical protein
MGMELVWKLVAGSLTKSFGENTFETSMKEPSSRRLNNS